MIEIKEKEEKGDRIEDFILLSFITVISLALWFKFFHGYATEYGLVSGLIEATLGKALEGRNTLFETYAVLSIRLFLLLAIPAHLFFTGYVIRTLGKFSAERRLKQLFTIYILILTLSSLIAAMLFLYVFKKIRKVF